MPCKYIAVSGFGWSGSGAAVDLLKEFKGYKATPFEFRLIKDPYGLLDLEYFLVNKRDMLRSEVAIRDFQKFCKILDRKNIRFLGRGDNYSSNLGIDFLASSEIYIESITDLKYLGRSLVLDYFKGKVEFFTEKIKHRFLVNSKDKLRVAMPTREEFLSKTKLYMDRIFSSYASSECLVLDQAIPTSDIDRAMNYFNDLKLIVVDRDPRDIYVDLVNKRSLIGEELRNTNDVSKFVKWFSSSRESTTQNNSNILNIRFEDLILSYDDTLLKILGFIGGDIDHTNKFMFLDPAKSVKNIGKWKSYGRSDIMKIIERDLGEYCI